MRQVSFLASLFCAVFGFSCINAAEDSPTLTPLASGDSQDRDKPAIAYARPECLVSTEVLSRLLLAKDPELVVIDARAQDAFHSGHIQNARNIESDILQDAQRPPYCLVSRERIAEIAAACGIHSNSFIVICDEDDGRLSARVWFTLHAYGHNSVAILNGGLGKWRAENRLLTTQESSPFATGSFKPQDTMRGLCGFNDLPKFKIRAGAMGSLPPVTILDARSTAEYMGEDSRAAHAGHIPGAANLEWSSMLDGPERERIWKSPARLGAFLKLASVERNRDLVVYDQAGGRSSHLYFTLWLMGYTRIYNYTAGWREYGNKDDVEIER